MEFETLNDADFGASAHRVTTKVGTSTQYSITSVSAMAGSTRTFSYKCSEIRGFKIHHDENMIESFQVQLGHYSR